MLKVFTPVSVDTATPAPPVIWPVFVMVTANGPLVKIAAFDPPSITPLFTITASPPTDDNPTPPPVMVPALLNLPPPFASMPLP